MGAFFEGLGGALPLILWAVVVACVLPPAWMPYGLWAPVVVLCAYVVFMLGRLGWLLWRDRR